MMAEYGEADVGWLEPLLVQAKTGTKQKPVNDGDFPNMMGV
jgi:hypothetical protein